MCIRDSLHRRRVAQRLYTALKTQTRLLLEDGGVGKSVGTLRHARRETAVGHFPNQDGAYDAAAVRLGLGNRPPQSIDTRFGSIDAHDIPPGVNRLLLLGHSRSFRSGLGYFLSPRY